MDGSIEDTENETMVKSRNERERRETLRERRETLRTRMIKEPNPKRRMTTEEMNGGNATTNGMNTEQNNKGKTVSEKGQKEGKDRRHDMKTGVNHGE